MTDPVAIPILIVFAKFGLAGGYSLCYYMTTEYFPVLFLAFAFGLTQFMARAFTIAAFPLSELDQPIPMILFSSTPMLAFVMLFFVRSPVEDEDFRRESMRIVLDNKLRNSVRMAKKLSKL